VLIGRSVRDVDDGPGEGGVQARAEALGVLTLVQLGGQASRKAALRAVPPSMSVTETSSAPGMVA
jgi:hypothetical protein